MMLSLKPFSGAQGAVKRLQQVAAAFPPQLSCVSTSLVVRGSFTVENMDLSPMPKHTLLLPGLVAHASSQLRALPWPLKASSLVVEHLGEESSVCLPDHLRSGLFQPCFGALVSVLVGGTPMHYLPSSVSLLGDPKLLQDITDPGR